MKESLENSRDFGHLIVKVINGHKLSREECYYAYKQIILNKPPELQQGAFLAAHLASNPTLDEICGAWDAIDLHDTEKISIACDANEIICDIVGTGSDSFKTVNCSSPAAIIAASRGLKVAKKGAKKVTGVSGATCIFEQLGIETNAPLSVSQMSLQEIGMCYLPGEVFLKSGWARLIKSMNFTSVFNIVGPLTLPCPQTNAIVIGAWNSSLCKTLVEILQRLKIPRAIAPFGLIYGQEHLGIDEFSPCGSTKVFELKESKIESYELHPHDFGIKLCSPSKIASKQNAIENANAILNVFQGEYDTPLADFFCINASAALYISGHAESFVKGTEMAREALANGAALEMLTKLRKMYKMLPMSQEVQTQFV